MHLAGAAEELLGKHLPEEQRTLAFASRAERALVAETERCLSEKEACDRLLAVKNQIKHMTDSNDATVTFQHGLLAEATFLIRQAVINLYKLDWPDTPAIRKFEDHRRRELSALMSPPSGQA